MDQEYVPSENLKRFHRSDTLYYRYNVIDLDTLSWKEPAFTRCKVALNASNGVKWWQIRDEVSVSSLGKPEKNPHLSTCVVDADDFLVALTYNGFLAALSEMPPYFTREENIEALSKHLVALRDYRAHVIGELRPGIDFVSLMPGDELNLSARDGKKLSDFIPTEAAPKLMGC